MSTQASSPLSFKVSAGRFNYIADIENPTSMVIAVAILFNLLFLAGTLHMFRHKAWFLGTFSTALLLESGGFIALGYLSTHVTNHVAYLVSFSALNLGPSFLILSAFVAFGRLMKSFNKTEPDHTVRVLWLPQHLLAPVFIAVEVMAMMFFAFAIKELSALHSSKPITSADDAISRLVSEAQAVAMLSTGYTIQLGCLGLFMLVARGSMYTEHAGADRQWMKVHLAMQGVAAFSLVRTAAKVATYATLESQTLDVLGDGRGPWLLDIVPLILAFAIFTAFYAGVIPADFPSSTARQETDCEEKAVLLSYENAMSC